MAENDLKVIVKETKLYTDVKILIRETSLEGFEIKVLEGMHGVIGK